MKSWKQKFHDHTGQKRNSFQVAFLLQGSVISTVAPWVGFFSGYSLFITLLKDWIKYISFPQLDNSGGITHIIVSFNLLLSLLLIFRTNAAYERYWEGRKLWGSLVNTVRNLARGILITIEQQFQIQNLSIDIRLFCRQIIENKVNKSEIWNVNSHFQSRIWNC